MARVRLIRLSIGNALLLAVVATIASPVGSAQARKKKLSLAELAALEWKIEQATSALTAQPSAKARLKALRDLASVTDHRVVPPLARALKEDPEAQVRLEAAKALSQIKTPEAKGLLTLAAQADPDPGVRQAAKAGLSKMPRRLSVAALKLGPLRAKRPSKADGNAIKRLLNLPSGDGRLWAVKQAKTVRFGGREALLKKHLRRDPSSRVRIACARALVKIAGKRALRDLIKAASDGDPAVRFEILRTLASYDDGGALVAVQRLSADDPNKTVRAEAKDLLEPSTPVGQRLLKRRIKALASANPSTRIRALGELAKFTHWRAMLPMSCTLLSDKSAPVRASAAKTLTHMHDTSVLTALRVAAVIEPDASQKKRVRGMLQGLRKQVDRLIKQLKAPEPIERVRAARALGQAAYPPGLKPLIAALKDKDPRVRRTAAHGLTNFAAKKVDGALRLAGSDADRTVRSIVDRYFKQRERLAGWRKFFRDKNRLVTKTMDPDPNWRANAAVALGIAGAESAVGSLVNLLLRDKSEKVRLAAAWGLRLMSSDASEKGLRKAAAKDKSERVRLAARKYLVIHKIGVPDLVTQLRDESASVRRDAAEALSLRANSKVLHHLIRAAMCDSSADVRARALRGLTRIGNPLAKTVINVAQVRDANKDVKRVAMMMYILAGGK